MAQRRHHQSKRRSRAARAHPASVRAPIPVRERKPPVAYGKPFILLENDQKDTFIYNAGQWVPHTKSIAECRLNCQVKELAQKINGMTRYEICSPVPSVTTA